MWPCIVNLVDKRAENSMGSSRFHCDWAFPCPGLPIDATEQQQCVQDTPRCSVRGSVYPAEGRRPSFHFSQSDALGPMGSCEKVSCASSWTIAKAQHRNGSLFLTLYPVCLPTSHLHHLPEVCRPRQGCTEQILYEKKCIVGSQGKVTPTRQTDWSEWLIAEC